MESLIGSKFKSRLDPIQVLSENMIIFMVIMIPSYRFRFRSDFFSRFLSDLESRSLLKNDFSFSFIQEEILKMRFFGIFILTDFINSERTDCHDRDGRFVWWLENCPGVGISNDTGLRLQKNFSFEPSLSG